MVPSSTVGGQGIGSGMGNKEIGLVWLSLLTVPNREVWLFLNFQEDEHARVAPILF